MKSSIKKLFILTLAALFVLNLSACRKNNDDTSSGSSLSAVTADTAVSSDATASGESPSDTVTTSDISSVSSDTESRQEEKPSQVSSSLPEKVCQHDYTYTEEGVTCTKDGYREYICRKCGHTYKGERVAAHHDYGKYLCELCGKIDPTTASPFWALNAWIEEYGKLSGNGIYYCYPDDVSNIRMSAMPGQEMLCVEYVDNENKLTFSLNVGNKAECTIMFLCLDGSHGDCDEIKNSAVSSANKLEFTYFYSQDGTLDEDVFATMCAKNTDKYMLTIQSEILSKTGLTLYDLGFTAYK